MRSNDFCRNLGSAGQEKERYSEVIQIEQRGNDNLIGERLFIIHAQCVFTISVVQCNDYGKLHIYRNKEQRTRVVTHQFLNMESRISGKVEPSHLQNCLLHHIKITQSLRATLLRGFVKRKASDKSQNPDQGYVQASPSYLERAGKTM